MLNRARQAQIGTADNAYDDLHIDRIDETWRHWIPGGLAAFHLALLVRDRHKFGFTVTLAFSLTSSCRFTGIDFQNFADLAAKLDSAPPSLYCFEPGQEPWLQILQRVQNGAAEHGAFVRALDKSFFPSELSVTNCFYIEFRQKEFEDYFRTIFFAARTETAS